MLAGSSKSVTEKVELRIEGKQQQSNNREILSRNFSPWKKKQITLV